MNQECFGMSLEPASRTHAARHQTHLPTSRPSALPSSGCSSVLNQKMTREIDDKKMIPQRRHCDASRPGRVPVVLNHCAS